MNVPVSVIAVVGGPPETAVTQTTMSVKPLVSIRSPYIANVFNFNFYPLEVASR